MDKKQINYILRNNLQEILKERGITQKELAEAIGERPNSIGEFISLSRTTINIELLLKISSYLNVSHIEDILRIVPSFSKTYLHELNMWYRSNLQKYDERAGFVKYSFNYENNKEVFMVMEVTDDGVFFHYEYVLTGKEISEIEKDFEKLELQIPQDYKKDEMIYKLIQICRYNHEKLEIKRYKTKEEAMDVMETLSEYIYC